LVNLQQFSKQDKEPVVINTTTAQWHQGMVPGLQVMHLHTFEHEHVALVK